MTTTRGSHLNAEEVAAFLDRRNTAAERASVEAHLADCHECRVEVAAVRRMMSVSSIRRPMLLVPAGLAAAAAIAFIAISLQRDSGPPTERVRALVPASADATARIEVVSPVDGDTIALARAALTWSAIAGEPTYRLTVTDASGQTLYTSTTTDTVLLLPGNVLKPHSIHFWYVDALRADGRAASTGVRRFEIP